MERCDWFREFAGAIHSKELQRIMGIDAFTLDGQLAVVERSSTADPLPSEDFASYVGRMANLLARPVPDVAKETVSCQRV